MTGPQARQSTKTLRLKARGERERLSGCEPAPQPG
jgi:hypothetical protein